MCPGVDPPPPVPPGGKGIKAKQNWLQKFIAWLKKLIG
jgi:hypothetical protein